MPMAAAAPKTTDRNELILDLCCEHDSATIAARVYRELGAYLTPNAVNCVIDRAKRAKDPRALARKSRRGRRSSSPWNRPRKKSDGPPKPVLAVDLPEVEVLPPTALLFINTFAKNCKFPLRGSGIGLIVCGADVAEKSSYCPECRKRTILQDEGSRAPAAAGIPNDRTLRSNEDRAVPRAQPRVEQRVAVPAGRPKREKPVTAARTRGRPKVRAGIDGVDLAGLPPLPVRMRRGPRVLEPKPPQRTFFDRGQLDLFGPATCAGYIDRGFRDYGGRTWLTASAFRQATSSPG